MKLLSWASFALITGLTFGTGQGSSVNSSDEKVCEASGTCSEALSNHWDERADPPPPSNKGNNDPIGDSVDVSLLTMGVMSLEWDEMSPQQKLLLEARGYDEEEWDEGEHSEVGWYDIFLWKELCEEKQMHLTTLGWNEQMWDEKLNDHVVLYRPSTETRPWSRLFPAEQEAAKAIGFDSESWPARDWEGDREFNPVKFKFDIPELSKYNFDYLRSLDMHVNTIPESENAGDDETVPFVEIPVTEFVDSLRAGKPLYIKYEGTDEGDTPKEIQTTIKNSLRKVLETTPLKDVGLFGPEHKDAEIVEDDYISMYIGGANSTSHVHVDHQAFNFIYIVEGRKRVILMPNDHRTAKQFPIVKETFLSAWPGVDILNGPLPEHAVETILVAGEGMQIPYYSWHAVQNLEPTISYGLIREYPYTLPRKEIPLDYSILKRNLEKLKSKGKISDATLSSMY